VGTVPAALVGKRNQGGGRDFTTSLLIRQQAAWKQAVEEEEWVLRNVGTVTLQKVGLVPSEDGTRVKDAIEAFLRYTDKPMIASRDAVLQGLRLACKEKLIGIGRGMGLGSLQKKWCGEDVALDPNEEGLWIIPPFEAVPTAADVHDGTGELPTGVHPPRVGPPGGGGDQTTTGVPVGPMVGPAAGRQIRKVTINGSVPLESWSEVFKCFVNPAVRLNLKLKRLGIDFEVEMPAGATLDENNATFKSMKESARQLGLNFETED